MASDEPADLLLEQYEIAKETVRKEKKRRGGAVDPLQFGRTVAVVWFGWRLFFLLWYRPMFQREGLGGVRGWWPPPTPTPREKIEREREARRCRIINLPLRFHVAF